MLPVTCFSAIANYTQAVETWQSLCSELATISSDVQFSFRESVEPVYRKLIGLLLPPQQELKVDNPEKSFQQ